MQIYCFKIINDLQKVQELLNKFSLKKHLKNSEYVSIKNNFIFFKANFEELDTNFKKIKFLNSHVFKYPEPFNFYKRNNLLIQKNLFLDNPNIAFINDGRIIKLVI